MAAGGTADSTPDLEPLYPPISSGSQNQQSSCSCSNLTKYQQGARWNQAGAFESKSLPSIPELKHRLSYKNHSRCLNKGGNRFDVLSLKQTLIFLLCLKQGLIHIALSSLGPTVWTRLVSNLQQTSAETSPPECCI